MCFFLWCRILSLRFVTNLKNLWNINMNMFNQCWYPANLLWHVLRTLAHASILIPANKHIFAHHMCRRLYSVRQPSHITPNEISVCKRKFSPSNSLCLSLLIPEHRGICAITCASWCRRADTWKFIFSWLACTCQKVHLTKIFHKFGYYNNRKFTMYKKGYTIVVCAI